MYESKQDAYFKYYNFIKKYAQPILGEDAEPYELEMLLFVIADREIFKDMKESIKLGFRFVPT